MRPRYADLFEAFKDLDPARADAAFDAVLFDRAEAIPDLIELYERERAGDPLLRFYAVQLLGFSEDARAVPAVVTSLEDPDPGVRAEACRALEDLRAKEALDMVQRRTRDLDPNVRRAARDTIRVLSGRRG